MNVSELLAKFKKKPVVDALSSESNVATPSGLSDWDRDATIATSLKEEHATAMTERTSFVNLFSYQSFDSVRNFWYLDDGEDRAVGFGFMFSPLNSAGTQAETSFENIIKSLPPDSIVQFCMLMSPQVEGALNIWANSRLAKTNNDLLRMITVARRDFYLNTIQDLSLASDAAFHPRMAQYYCLIRIPYVKEIESESSLKRFLSDVSDCQQKVEGVLSALKLGPEPVTEWDFKVLMRELLNPHVNPSSRVSTINSNISISQDMLMRNTRVVVQEDGTVGFSNKAGKPAVVAASLTVDATPEIVSLPMMAATLGKLTERDERISQPYWAYTTIHVLHPDKAKDELTTKFGALNKQTMSESEWFRSMMGHLYERKNRVEGLLKELSKGHQLVRCYSGMILYSSADRVKNDIENVKTLYSNSGFRITAESYIGLPTFVAAMPFQYNHEMDPPNRGLQRAWLMSSLNACSMLQVRGDWKGTGFERGGLLVTSRQGQIASFDLLKTTTNMNFVVVAQSGSGKSFLTNDLVVDFLSKGGIARIIDVGRSYAAICETMGGQLLEFKMDKPISLNPFTGVRTQIQLNEMMPILKDLLRLMAFPITPEERVPPEQYQLLEEAIVQAWNQHNEFTELRHITEWLQTNHRDMGGDKLAMQLRPFATGRYAQWFSGPRTIEFSNSFVVVELEELKADANLQSVVLQLVMYRMTQEMYMMSLSVPKFLAIDEAWDLLGGLRTGKFIETAFRRIRKYNGIAGVITQSFEDFEKSEASKACIENAEWQFILEQKVTSLKYAAKHGRIDADDALVELLSTVKRSKGRSELFVRGGGGFGLYVLFVDYHSLYLYTTTQEERAGRDELVRNGYTLAEAIDIVADKAYVGRWGPDYKSRLRYSG